MIALLSKLKIAKLLTTYTIIMFLIGLVLVLFSLNFDNKLISFLNGLGYNLINLSIIGVLLNFQDWKNYFQERLSDIVIDKSYLKKLNKEQLINLQNDTLKAFFETDNVGREGSFLNYFHSEIHNLIGSPYRENINLILNINHENERFLIDDVIEYTCREVKGEIQPNVKWKPGEEEFEKVFSLRVTISCPENQKENCTLDCKPCEENTLFFYQSNEEENEQEASTIDDGKENDLGKAESISLDKYKHIDKLAVKIVSRYKAKTDKYYTWEMAHPTKGFNLTIHFPENFNIVYDILGLNQKRVKVIKQNGLFNIRYDDWVLPATGLVYQFINKQVVQSNESE